MACTLRVVGLAIISLVLTVTTPSVIAADASPANPFLPFVGNWHGNGELAEAGLAPVRLALSLSCFKASAGYAVSCRMQGKSPSMLMDESDLFGVDPVTGKGHWYTVSNLGETHDHEAVWKDGKILTGTYSWQQEGKQMREDIRVDFRIKRTMTFLGTTTANGKTVSEFRGEMKR